MEGFNPKAKSEGLGDTVAKVTHFFGIDKVADAVAKLAGAEGCGCSERRQLLNELFPYASKTRKFKVLNNFTEFNKRYVKGEIIEVTGKDILREAVIKLAKEGFITEILEDDNS